MTPSYLDVAPSAEEGPDDEDLESAHGHHSSTLQESEPEDTVFGGLDSAHVSILPRPKVLLRPTHLTDLRAKLQDTLLNGTRLIGADACLLRQHGGPRLVLHLNLEIDNLVGDSGDAVVEAELILARGGGSEDKVALFLLVTVEDDMSPGTLDVVVDVKFTPSLNLQVSGTCRRTDPRRVRDRERDLRRSKKRSSHALYRHVCRSMHSRSP